ncbi:hypothetical protein D3C72_1358290 [compost metagenome]
MTAGQVFEPGLRGPSRRDRLFRVLVAEVGQVEGGARQKNRRLDDRLGRVAEQAGHCGDGLEPAFGVGFQPEAGRLDGHAFTDAGQDVLKVAVLRCGVEDVVERQKGSACPSRYAL